MRVLLRTAVAQPPAQVMAGFTRALFVALAPPVPKLVLHRFDGSRTGDVVEIELKTGDKAPFSDGTETGLPKLFNRACVGSNLNLMIKDGSSGCL